ncbi:hypothetical protein CHS0354_028041, partial [Potamilus streckersoni]
MSSLRKLDASLDCLNYDGNDHDDDSKDGDYDKNDDNDSCNEDYNSGNKMYKRRERNRTWSNMNCVMVV